MKKAAFSLDNYRFNKIFINSDNTPTEDISIDFKPSGIFDSETKSFELALDFTAFSEEKGIDNYFMKITCLSIFSFDEVNTVEEIPPYFYKNSIAIVYPFIRAFVSSVSLQANVKPIILPTMNLSSLEIPLKENTVSK